MKNERKTMKTIEFRDVFTDVLRSPWPPTAKCYYGEDFYQPEKDESRFFFEVELPDVGGDDGTLFNVTCVERFKKHENRLSDPYGIETWWESKGVEVLTVVFIDDAGREFSVPFSADEGDQIYKILRPHRFN